MPFNVLLVIPARLFATHRHAHNLLTSSLTTFARFELPLPSRSNRSCFCYLMWLSLLKSKNSLISCLFVIPGRFERPTHSLEGCCSIQLSYGTIFRLQKYIFFQFQQREFSCFSGPKPLFFSARQLQVSEQL